MSILLKIENKKFAISRQLNISHFNKKKTFNILKQSVLIFLSYFENLCI